MDITLELQCAVYTVGQLPRLDAPQIGLAGRSNVGKSSLINALAGRKNLAKVSAAPGKTRSLNFYFASPPGFYLVDLPGYGFARASHAERRGWGKLLNAYLDSAVALKGLALLLDCRLPPQALDLELADFAQAKRLPLLPILTKVDKAKQTDRARRQNEWQSILGQKPLLASATKRIGIDAVWRGLLNLACEGGEQEEEGSSFHGDSPLLHLTGES